MPDRSEDRPAVDIQSLSRSCHQVLILGTLRTAPHHGYQLALELEEKSGGAFRFRHGTLYPILHKLESDGLIRGDWLAQESRRKRKSYRITAAGLEFLEREISAWRSFFDHFLHVVEEERS
jgi:PadR family transcriptional regulator PadR